MNDPFVAELGRVLGMPQLALLPAGAAAAPGCQLYPVPDTPWQAQLPVEICNPRTVFQICALLRQHVCGRDRERQASAQLKQLTRELDALVDVSLLAADETRLGQGILPDLGEVRWAVFKNGKLLVNNGLSDHVIVPSVRRLEREEEFSYVVSQGEHWVLSVGRFAVICESAQRISPLLRQLIRLRLEWLNRSLREREMAERMQDLLRLHQADVERLRDDEAASRWSAVELRQHLDKLHRDFEGTLRQATTDSLTHAYNRAKIDQILSSFCARSEAVAPFCLLALDVDRFKLVNDAHGHLAGDRVLIEVVSAIRATLRQTDVLARWGGDEFLVLLPESDLTVSMACAERLREAVSGIPSNAKLRVTISVGVAMHQVGETPDGLFQRADGALYEAKRSGRDRVVASERRGR